MDGMGWMEMDMDCGTVGWANNQLRLAIRLLKGQVCNQSYTRAISDAISIRFWLNAYGFWWQSRVVGVWIGKIRSRAEKRFDRA